MKLSKQIYCYLFLFFSFTCIVAQHETSKWYFGNQAGLDFMTTPPSPLSNSSMNSIEACASISDSNGNLLFYSEGTTVWNQSHSIMANGNGLLGHISASQGAMIIKHPGSTSEYFVFTLDEQAGSNGLRYSIVDMNLAAGMGSVTIKNVLLQTPSSEKLTAVKHCNGIDAWLVSHDTGSNSFRCFHISSSGINTVPVISSFPNSGDEYTYGCMKVSPNAKKLGMCVFSYGLPPVGGFELYDFDNTTGLLSNKLKLDTLDYAYGCEFSPDGTKFYGTATSGIFQWDLCYTNSSAIVASKFAVISNSTIPRKAIQMASDGKLYIARVFEPELGIIQNPNASGAACNYIDNGLSITSGTVIAGLPNFVSSYFFTKPAFPFGSVLSCLTATFSPLLCSFAAPDIVSVAWDFGDNASGAQNTSTVSNAIHLFSSAGTYTVQLIRNYTCYSDTIRQPLVVTGVNPVLTISGPTTICTGETVSYSVSGADTFTWSAGSPTVSNTQLLFSPASTGNFSFSVIGTNSLNHCSSTHSFQVKVSGCNGVVNTPDITDLKIYPNPTNGNIIVHSVAAMDICIYNQLGTVLLNEKIKAGEQKINLESFKNGVYYLKIRSDTRTPHYLRIIKTD